MDNGFQCSALDEQICGVQAGFKAGFPHEHSPHPGFVVVSGLTERRSASRVLIHVDTELAAKDLLNSRMAYVAVSRGAEDAQLFTNDREKLPQACQGACPRERRPSGRP
jgi:hypothetical protein